MSVIVPETRCERWLFLQLTSDATITGIVSNRVYANVAPKTASHPLVTFTLIAEPGEIYGNEATIIWSKLLYLVKAIGEGSSATALQTLVDRIHTVLHAQHGATSDARIDYCVRRRGFRMVSVEGDKQYQHLGGEYELAVAKA